MWLVQSGMATFLARLFGQGYTPAPSVISYHKPTTPSTSGSGWPRYWNFDYARTGNDIPIILTKNLAAWNDFNLRTNTGDNYKISQMYEEYRWVQCKPDISRSRISRNWIYRGRMLDPIFWRKERDIFREIAVTPWTQFAGDNFSRILLNAIAFVPGSQETIFREINSSLPVNAG